jgi:transposase
MKINWKKVQIFIKPGITDMRKQINGLAVITAEEMKKDPLNGHIYMFCNRNRRLLKVLYWDRNGFCLWMKRLEKHRFPWPNSAEEAREISEAELDLLLQGIDFFNVHKALHFSAVS